MLFQDVWDKPVVRISKESLLCQGHERKWERAHCNYSPIKATHDRGEVLEISCPVRKREWMLVSKKKKKNPKDDFLNSKILTYYHFFEKWIWKVLILYPHYHAATFLLLASFFFNWRIIELQGCVDICHATTRISHNFTFNLCAKNYVIHSQCFYFLQQSCKFGKMFCL